MKFQDVKGCGKPPLRHFVLAVFMCSFNATYMVATFFSIGVCRQKLHWPFEAQKCGAGSP